MKYPLLDFLRCFSCGGDLSCLIPTENSRGKKEFAIVNHLPDCEGNSPLMHILNEAEWKENVVKIENEEEIEEGLLICAGCGRWYPIRRFIPELLPDHLRDWNKDWEYFCSLDSKLPEEMFEELRLISRKFAGRSTEIDDKGHQYKKSEMHIMDKVTDEGFFQPGLFSPFNPSDTGYSVNIIRQFGNVIPLLEPKPGGVVLDIGPGYAWTTEWLLKMGFNPIGVDLCRTYLDIAVQRIGKNRPHLVIGDIENLPFKDNFADSVLCYNSFHHIPDRKRAVNGFYSALKDQGTIILSEPGKEHESAPQSKEVMKKYGILERGMELSDIRKYCRGLKIDPPRQYYILKTEQSENGRRLSSVFIDSHLYMDSHIFWIRKNICGEKKVPAPGIISKIKSKLRRMLRAFVFLF